MGMSSSSTRRATKGASISNRSGIEKTAKGGSVTADILTPLHVTLDLANLDTSTRRLQFGHTTSWGESGWCARVGMVT